MTWKTLEPVNLNYEAPLTFLSYWNGKLFVSKNCGIMFIPLALFRWLILLEYLSCFGGSSILFFYIIIDLRMFCRF